MSIFLFVIYRISMIFMLIFLLLFQPLQKRKWQIVCVLCLCFVMTGILDGYEFLYEHNRALSIPTVLFQVVMVQLTAFVLCKYMDFRALFTGLTSSVYVLAGNILCMFIYIISEQLVISILVQILTHLLILLCMIFQMRENYKEEIQVDSPNWKYLCILPILFYMIEEGLVSWPSNIYDVPQNVVPAMLVLVLMLAAYIVVVRILTMQRKATELRRNNEYMENYAKHLRRNVEIFEANEKRMSIVRHDMRHLAILISSYLEQNRPDEIRKVLQEWNQKLDVVKPRKLCGNIALNGLFSFYADMAEKSNVIFSVKVDLPARLPVNEYDFATVIANLTENAVQAAMEVSESKRYVKVVSNMIKNQLILEISNSFTGNSTISTETGLPETSKGNGHGFGLRSVTTFAEKNNAIFDYSIEDNEFIVRLLVPISVPM